MVLMTVAYGINGLSQTDCEPLETSTIAVVSVFFRQNFLVKISFSVNKCCLEKIDETLWIAPIENRNSHAQKLVK